MSDILGRIVEETRKSLAAEALDLTTRIERPPHRFSAALNGGRATSPRVIAEIKAASPSAGTIVENPDVEAIASAYRQGGASAISIVTEPKFFRGSRKWIARASDASDLPVVMKDFIIDPVQIERGIAAGADAILLIVAIVEPQQLRDFISRIQSRGRDALVEVHDERELEIALDAGARVVGVNNRNLRDFGVDLGVSERLVRLIPDDVSRVSESGIKTFADVERLHRAGFDAFLVGESLLRQSDHAAAVRALLNRAGSRPLVKICGITRVEDALVAAGAGASFLGFVFVSTSKRNIAPEVARVIADEVRSRPSPPKLVGVFRNESAERINAVTDQVGLDLVQLHGDEAPMFLAALNRPAIKALPVGTSVPDAQAYGNADWILFDAAKNGAWGGLGEAFDWRLLSKDRIVKRFFLAGGLTPENVASAIAEAQPDAIDISTGVEDAPGQKSAEKIRLLFEEIARQ